MIEHLVYPFPSEDGRCKILMVANKPDLVRDEPIRAENRTVNVSINKRYLSGSIDHLTLQEYGLTTDDYIMFIVTFPQLHLT